MSCCGPKNASPAKDAANLPKANDAPNPKASTCCGGGGHKATTEEETAQPRPATGADAHASHQH